MVAIVGPSGCGKSTLLDLLALISKPDSSETFSITFGGNSFFSLSSSPLTETQSADCRRRHLGYILQRGGLLPSLNCLENILLPRILAGRTASLKEILPLVDTLKIADQLYKKPAYLSGGQRQRVAIARALSHQPSVVLADEPTGSVDGVVAEEICQLLKDLARKQKTAVVLVTHDHDLAARHVAKFYSFDLKRSPNGEVTSTLKVLPHE
jgi:putative ABC transport system ATP-binding protein